MAAPTLTFAEKERPVEQTMTPEEQYGVIKAPDSPLMAKAAMMFRDVERSVEGSPAEFMLPGGGIATVLEKKAYGQEPTALDYGFAAFDAADFVPGLGKMAIFAGAASASGVKKIRELLEREQAGQTSEQIFAETNAFRSPLHGRPQFEIDPSNASLKENSAFSNANTPVRKFRQDQTKQEQLDKTDPIQYPSTYRSLLEDIQQEKELFGRVVPVGGVVDESKIYPHSKGPKIFSAEAKGPLTLSEIVDFPELFKEYPEAKNIPIEDLPPHLGYGMFDSVTGTIYIRAGDKNEVLPTLMHEVQHWVQNHEGFPFGDAPDAIPSDLKERILASNKRVSDLKDKVKALIRPNIVSAMQVRAITSGLRGAEIPQVMVDRQVESAANNLFSLYKSLGKENTAPTTKEFLEYAKKQGFGDVSDLIENAPGGAEAFFNLAGPFMRRFNAEAEEAFNLAYAKRLAQERANKKYSSTAGEIEARIVEDTARTGNRPAPSQRFQEELEKSEIDEIRFAERFPPTSEIIDDFGGVRVPEQKATGGGVGSSINKAYTNFINSLRGIGRLYNQLNLTSQVYRGLGSLFQPTPQFPLPNSMGGPDPYFIPGIPISPGSVGPSNTVPQDEVSQYEDAVVGQQYINRPIQIKEIVTPPPQNESTVDPTFNFAEGGGVGSMAPVARNMFQGYDIRRGVGAYAPYTRRA